MAFLRQFGKKQVDDGGKLLRLCFTDACGKRLFYMKNLQLLVKWRVV